MSSRRTAMKAATLSALAFAAAGCGIDADDRRGERAAVPTPTTPSTTVQDIDIRLVVEAISDEERLLAFCATAARRFVSQRALLDGLVDRQTQHVARLRAALTELRPPVSHSRPTVPRQQRVLAQVVAGLVIEARDARSADCTRATSGLLAELFGVMAASHAVTGWVAGPKTAVLPVPIPDSVVNVDVLQPCLAAEHAALFGYGLLGGALSAGVSDAPPAVASVSSYNAHRDRRDALVELITAGGREPAPPQAAYEPPSRSPGCRAHGGWRGTWRRVVPPSTRGPSPRRPASPGCSSAARSSTARSAVRDGARRRRRSRGCDRRRHELGSGRNSIESPNSCQR